MSFVASDEGHCISEGGHEFGPEYRRWRGLGEHVSELAIAAFTCAVALALLAAGPLVMRHLFGQSFSYDRFGLALVGVGMGLHLASGALNQAALARDHARAAALSWLMAAGAFVAWMLVPAVPDELARTEIGYAGATGVLAALLWMVYRRGAPRARGAAQSAATERAIAR
jgi:O-antigen/teichoic acid export membrane protein